MNLLHLILRLKKITPSKMDNRIPRMPKAVSVVELDDEEKSLIIQLLEKEHESQTQITERN